MNASELRILSPLFIPALGALFILLAAAFLKQNSRVPLLVTVLSLAASAVALFQWNTPVQFFDGALRCDPFSKSLSLLVLISALLSCFMAWDQLKRLGQETPEFFALTLFAVTGMMLMTASADLVVMFLSLEVMSVALYILCGINRKSDRSTESALKYFVVGAFSSAILLYGIVLAYGVFGTTRLPAIAEIAAAGSFTANGLFLVSLICLITGLGFKVASVPFHAWVPDVYQGAPTPVAAFMSVGVKVATVAILLRLFLTAFFPMAAAWVPALWWIAVLTMSLGNLAALMQENVKRMAAYSSIAHGGYLFVGLTALDPNLGAAAEGVVYYLVAYAVMNLGLFAVVSQVEEDDETMLTFDDYRGLGLRQPLTGAVLSIFLFSLAGIPPLAGFFGKYYLFTAAVGKGFIGLAVIGVLNSLVSAYFYLRLMVKMYMQEPADEKSPVSRARPSVLTTFAVLFCAFFTLWFGLGPIDLGCCVPSADHLWIIIRNAIYALL